MFDPSSRYATLEILTRTGPDGREIKYVARRFVPPPAPGTVIREHVVTEGERLDHIAARYLGDPELYWQIADVNKAMRAEALVEEVGRRLIVALLPEVGR
jgi:nucleoid-associated protein YgaU